jgi:hypothetical protein
MLRLPSSVFGRSHQPLSQGRLWRTPSPLKAILKRLRCSSPYGGSNLAFRLRTKDSVCGNFSVEGPAACCRDVALPCVSMGAVLN